MILHHRRLEGIYHFCFSYYMLGVFLHFNPKKLHLVLSCLYRSPSYGHLYCHLRPTRGERNFDFMSLRLLWTCNTIVMCCPQT